MSEMNTFDPVLYSKAENRFLLDALGKPPVVVLRDIPAGVNPRAVRPIVQRVYELMELEKHERVPWVGIDALKEKINAYITNDDKWARDHQRSRTAPRYPSLYSYDVRGKAHKGGIGSDNGRVRTYFGPNGERIPFAVDLVPDRDESWTPPTLTDEAPKGSLLVEDASMRRFECHVPQDNGGVCGHTESYKADSRASRSAARARMSKHLRKSLDNAEGHRELYTNEFGS